MSRTFLSFALPTGILLMGYLVSTNIITPIGVGRSDKDKNNMMKHFIIEKTTNGSEVVDVKWAVKSRDNVTLLRIPKAYVNPFSFTDCISMGGSGPSEACSLPYAVELILTANLPYLEPLQKETHTEEEDRSTASIFIRSVLWGTKSLSEKEGQSIAAGIATEFLNFGPPKNRFPVVEKSGAFGLRRIGLLHDVDAATATSFKDIYFDGESPITSENFMVCTDDVVPTRLDDRHSPGVPSCEQYFVDRSISSTIKVRYERQYLKDWQDIKISILTLINSFM